MRYKGFEVPDKEIDKIVDKLDCSILDACDMYLADKGLISNDEQDSLDDTAKKVKIDKGAGYEIGKTAKKPRTVKVSDEKSNLFEMVSDNLKMVYGEKAQIVKENKLITIEINGKKFKIDFVEERPTKK